MILLRCRQAVVILQIFYELFSAPYLTLPLLVLYLVEETVNCYLLVDIHYLNYTTIQKVVFIALLAQSFCQIASLYLSVTKNVCGIVRSQEMFVNACLVDPITDNGP